MTAANSSFLLLALLFAAQPATAADGDSLEKSFSQHVQPFLKRYCVRCHNADRMKSGVRLDQLDPKLEDRQLKLWEHVLKQADTRAMPPEEATQPTDAERAQAVAWVERALRVARLRPAPKNGSVRRLTAAQYRNTLRELLLLEDNLADVLPPDAVSRDGFVNNQETLQLSPLLLEAYLDIAGRALDRCIVDPTAKPTVQNFRVELGAGVNPAPIPDKLILGAESLLLNNADFRVEQLRPARPFAYEPFAMRTKYRFIEGYQGNDTVRGWREYDSIYHAVYACVRGTPGYPKGRAYDTVPQGLLLRPAIPSSELFGVESTYGPRANFKIALRELPDHDRFRVTVTAAKYDDGLLLDAGAAPGQGAGAVVCPDPASPKTVTIRQPGIYQVDVHTARADGPAAVDGSRLAEDLIGAWPLDGSAKSKPEREELGGRLVGGAKFVASPFGRALSLDGGNDWVVVPRHESMNVGTGDFTVAAWIHPCELRQAGIVCRGKYGWAQGWLFDMPDNQGILRLETAGPDNKSNGTVASPPGTLRANAWQHVAAVVRRTGETRLFVNGYPVATGRIGPANLDNPHVGLHVGRVPDAQRFRGELSGVRLYRRALGVAEVQALVEPGRKFATPPPEKPAELTLKLGDREFTAARTQPAFLAVRLPAGPLKVHAVTAGTPPDRVVFTPLAADHDVARRFTAFESRSPRVGVHLGLRRDCGSTLAPVGTPQTVSSGRLTRFVFEGCVYNFPSPDVEKDNVNYLAGVREIGVRSEYTDGRDMPRLLIRSVEFEGPLYDSWPPATHRKLFTGADRADESPAYARTVIRDFATRAFRRPVTAAEEASLFAVYEKSARGGASFRAAVKDALQVVLTSPQFLFLVENSKTPAAEPLDGYELASKLSYFLWNGPPDAMTLALAASGELPKRLGEEVERMVADPRFERFAGEFAAQWLALEKFAVLEPDRARFPKLTRDARAQLRQEPVQFFQYLVRNNRPARDLIASDFIVANEVVAGYYGLGDRTESGFRFVPIRHGRADLGGVLTQAAILAGLSDGRESNPVKRGAWLARRIVAEPPDDPPPNVPALKEDTRQLPLRERLERHRNQPGCAQCHSKVDPWGVPLEEFDAGGRFKATRVDARSTLPDRTEVADFAALRKYLADDRVDQVAFSVLKHLATYAAGRTLTYAELESLKAEGHRLKADGYRMRDLIRYVVTSKIFLEK